MDFNHSLRSCNTHFLREKEIAFGDISPAFPMKNILTVSFLFKIDYIEFTWRFEVLKEIALWKSDELLFANFGIHRGNLIIRTLFRYKLMSNQF